MFSVDWMCTSGQTELVYSGEVEVNMYTDVHISSNLVRMLLEALTFSASVVVVCLLAAALEILLGRLRAKCQSIGRWFFLLFEVFLPIFLLADLMQLLRYRLVEGLAMASLGA